MNITHENETLIYTDYISLELYLVNKSILQKFFNVVLHGFPCDADTIINNTSPILELLYLIRLTNEVLDWNMVWLDYKKYIEIDISSIKFSSDKFIISYLSKNSKLHELANFYSTMEERRGILPDNILYKIHGHDFIDLLLMCVEKIKTKYRWGSHDSLAGSLWGCAELLDIKSHGLFKLIDDLFS